MFEKIKERLDKKEIKYLTKDEFLNYLKKMPLNTSLEFDRIENPFIVEVEIFDLFEDDVPLICKDFLYVEFLSKNPKKYVIEVSSMSTLENDIFKFKNNEDNLENIWNNALYNFLNENYDEIDWKEKIRMKVIFLDMDGVVNTANKDRYSLALKLTYDYDGYKDIFKFDPRTLINFIKLLRFCKKNEIGICITSTWRIGTSIEGWNEFIYRHLSKSLDMKEDDKIVIGLTNREHNGIRGLQIMDWLNSTKGVSDYLIVDDEISDIKDYFPSENILKTHSQSGLTEEKLKRIFSFFIRDYIEEDEE